MKNPERMYTEKEFNRVMKYLSKGWATASSINIACSVNSRKVRKMAEDTGDLLGGSKGYKRLDKATVSEIAHAYKSLMSRARKITTRAKILKSYL